MTPTKLSLALMTSVLAVTATANPVYFTPFEHDEHQDSKWSLTCDNINTCRADGYYDGVDGEVQNLASVLFERPAGQAMPKGLVALAFLEDKEIDKTQPVYMSVTGRQVGVVSPLDIHWQMSDKQVKAVMDEVAKTGKAGITFTQNRTLWQVSDIGLKEVLAKMDDVQHTKGTTYGLINKGSKAWSGKIPTTPLIKTYPVYSKQEHEPVQVSANSKEGKRLINLLKPTLKQLEGCDILEGVDDKLSFTITPLNYTHTLVTGSCFSGAYNFGDGAWVLDKSLTKVHQTVGMISEKDDNELYYYMKGRGLGDCWTVLSWAWVLDKFVMTDDHHTGQCKGFAGGAWYIPTLTTDQKEQDEWTITLIEIEK